MSFGPGHRTDSPPARSPGGSPLRSTSSHSALLGSPSSSRILRRTDSASSVGSRRSVVSEAEKELYHSPRINNKSLALASEDRVRPYAAEPIHTRLRLVKQESMEKIELKRQESAESLPFEPEISPASTKEAQDRAIKHRTNRRLAEASRTMRQWRAEEEISRTATRAHPAPTSTYTSQRTVKPVKAKHDLVSTRSTSDPQATGAPSARTAPASRSQVLDSTASPMVLMDANLWSLVEAFAGSNQRNGRHRKHKNSSSNTHESSYHDGHNHHHHRHHHHRTQHPSTHTSFDQAWTDQQAQRRPHRGGHRARPASADPTSRQHRRAVPMRTVRSVTPSRQQAYETSFAGPGSVRLDTAADEFSHGTPLSSLSAYPQSDHNSSQRHSIRDDNIHLIFARPTNSSIYRSRQKHVKTPEPGRDRWVGDSWQSTRRPLQTFGDPWEAPLPGQKQKARRRWSASVGAVLPMGAQR